MDTETVRDFYGRIIGYIVTNKMTGDKTAKDFYQRIIGRYEKRTNVTKDFYGRIVGRGDTLSSLIVQAEAENRNKEKTKK